MPAVIKWITARLNVVVRHRRFEAIDGGQKQID
jgi:hypothetical protein